MWSLGLVLRPMYSAIDLNESDRLQVHFTPYCSGDEEPLKRGVQQATKPNAHKQ